ncbi:YihA family ribosome biogenesis GTP-binding protein [Candidatus Falkowbacteria bacterium CG10_big_fil_rev_8_21_14_0_10_39_9]|uniref:Probable GTP-binding protein EngB n=1 Tax=Candidatus Falkowbacteria bacterium CG10_big_fil_rev_8_21_14_0_10_39_9 TaxID=1974566 RepID=A0A2M6WNL3_9BACT|nr:MAG: YihA family ribosome biogenesis GTP-binding protein [Candidatus Falkowbacteria bacterium CG10_big_fil_rev_8_21_14_0_10_39_9]
MIIKSARFIKGAVGPDKIFENEKAQVAFIGRSNVGKSSVINSITGQKDLARTSSFPGKTKEINLFLINDSFYLVDLPGYGYAKLPATMRQEIEILINWYFFVSGYVQRKVFLIIDAKVGPTPDDLEILRALEKYRKNIVIIANKVDKIKSSESSKQFKKINDLIGDHKIIPYSATKKLGLKDLLTELLQDHD